MTVLVVDIGTSSVRASLVRSDSSVTEIARKPTPPVSPMAGLVEFDADQMAAAVLEVARAAIAADPGVRAVGIASQRSSAIAWDATTGRALGPGLGWQDLRTAGDCLELQGEGFRLSPNEAATKYRWLLDTYDPGRSPTTRLGTVETWAAWHLSGGQLHVSDHSNAGTTGLIGADGTTWRDKVIDRLNLPPHSLPSLCCSSGEIGPCVALDGAPPLAAMSGDQQASLIGQSCTLEGLAKATFGTGGMLDVCTNERPRFEARSANGCFPIVAWSVDGVLSWGAEAIMLSAGSAIDWLVEDLGMLANPAQSAEVAATVETSGDVMMVPALLGLGTPVWDFGARGALLGFSRGSTRAHVVRAVLEGVAHRGADLLAAAAADTGTNQKTLRVDGGMSANPVFVQALADACAIPIELAPQLEATTLGAGYLAGMAVGMWSGTDEVAQAWQPRDTVDPLRPGAGRDRWTEAVSRAKSWYPELTAVQF